MGTGISEREHLVMDGCLGKVQDHALVGECMDWWVSAWTGG